MNTQTRRFIRYFLVGTFVLIVSLTFYDFSKVTIESLWDTDSVDLREGWVLVVDGVVVDSDFHLPDFDGNDTFYQKTVTLSRNIPFGIENLNSLLIRTSQKSITITVNGIERYSYDGLGSNRHIALAGYINHFVWLGENAAGKTLTITTVAHSKKEAGTFYNVYLGSRTSQIKLLYRYDGFSLVVGLIILFSVGAILIFSLPLYKERELLFSAFAVAGVELCVAFWVIGGTMATQLFIHNQLYLLLMGMLALYFLPVFLTWFVATMYKITALMPAIPVFPIAFILVSILQYAGVLTYYDVLIPTAILLLAYIGVLIYACIHSYRKGNKEVRGFLVAVAVLLLAVLAEVTLLFLPFETFINALFLNIGILLFGFILLHQVIRRILTFIRERAKLEYLQSLAHMDALTGLANRRAFDEDLAAIREGANQATSLGMIIFDVNDLKLVNDTQGHSAGDLLLQDVAKTLQALFGSEGTVYRIGGDEFAMICQGCTEEWFAAFESRLDEMLLHSSVVAFNLAFGSSFGVGADVKQIYHHADQKMYETKHAMKGQQSS